MSKTDEYVGISGSDSYSEGKFYPPYGQSRLYVGCNSGENSLIAVKYSGSGHTFDGCMGRGGVSAGKMKGLVEMNRV